MKRLLIFLLLITCFGASAQVWQPVGNNLQRQPTSKGYFYRFQLGAPGFMTIYTQHQIDSIALLKANTINTVTINGNSQQLGNNPNFTIAAKDTFVSNFKLNGVPNGFELWNNGDSVPAKGLTARQLILLGSQQAIHPNYNLPTAGISGSPGAGYYERGTSLSITLSSSYTQNDGGSLTGTVYKNGSTIITSPYSITLNAGVTLSVEKSYNTGVCKNNNLGVLDCQVGSGNAPNPAPVVSGIATANMGYGILDKGYAGYASSALVSGLPIQADILAAPYQDNSGGSTIATPSNPLATPQQGSDKRFFFITTGTRAHVSINGTPSDAAFTFNQPITFTNASGGTFNGYAQVSNFAIGSTGAITFVFN
jgi:hypothetical protein